jgi:L-amino acid N-acyltransferase YncA
LAKPYSLLCRRTAGSLFSNSGKGGRRCGQGIGSELFRFLIDCSEKKGFWTLQAGIFPKNKVSIEPHQRHGFRVLGVREKVGKMDFSELRGKWRDVVLIERRSKTAGID